ncbi:hypothetical protein TWF718_001479 [Orbilia javanica]|uniref:Prefoldin subunit 6 n=1 Tax=Orbilia javanica TaxID=47235 RepID=A0AAN8NHS2_9PEZI
MPSEVAQETEAHRPKEELDQSRRGSVEESYREPRLPYEVRNSAFEIVVLCRKTRGERTGGALRGGLSLAKSTWGKVRTKRQPRFRAGSARLACQNIIPHSQLSISCKAASNPTNQLTGHIIFNDNRRTGLANLLEGLLLLSGQDDIKMANVQQLSDEFSDLQKKLQDVIEARQKLDAQLSENQAVQKEFKTLDDDANIYKLIGPTLIKQDKDEAVMNVDKRLDFIEKEIKRIEGQIAEFSEASEKKKAEIMQIQMQQQAQAQQK